MLVHLTARTYAGRPLLDDWDLAARVWRSLRRAFPLALAVVLMPNHLHVVVSLADPARGVASLAHLLGALTRWARVRRGEVAAVEPAWAPVPPPAVVPDLHHLRRQVRYVALNPCRARLAPDPLAWVWSTHRDVVGASVDPWVTAERLAAALREPRAGFVARHHAYVSADPSCHVAGTPPPAPASPGPLARYSLARIAAAAAAATRARPTVGGVPDAGIRRPGPARDLFVQLAARHGWRDRRVVGDACGVTPRAVGKVRRRVARLSAAAGDLCLGDSRLVAPWETEGPASPGRIRPPSG